MVTWQAEKIWFWHYRMNVLHLQKFLGHLNVTCDFGGFSIINMFHIPLEVFLAFVFLVTGLYLPYGRKIIQNNDYSDDTHFCSRCLSVLQILLSSCACDFMQLSVLQYVCISCKHASQCLFWSLFHFCYDTIGYSFKKKACFKTLSTWPWLCMSKLFTNLHWILNVSLPQLKLLDFVLVHTKVSLLWFIL